MPATSELRGGFEREALPHLAAVFSFAMRLTRRSEDAHDLAQETFLRAFERFGSFRQGTNCKAWLFTITYSVFVNRYHRSRREPVAVGVEDHEGAIPSPQPDALVTPARATVEAAFEAALAELTEDFRHRHARRCRRLVVRGSGRGVGLRRRDREIATVPGPPAVGRAFERLRCHRAATSMTKLFHPELELQDLLDDRLESSERSRVEAHLEGCERCRADLEELRQVRERVRQLPRLDVPAELARDIETRLAQAEKTARDRTRIQRRRFLMYGLAAAAILVAVAYVARREDLPAAAIRNYENAKRGATSFDFVTTDPAAMEQLFNGRLPFKIRVFDLGMMDYRLVGGRVEEIASHTSAAYTYAGPGNRRLTCAMFRGSLSELPEPDERLSHNEITFLIYRRGAETAVFWIERDLVCVAVSDMPPEDVIALAFAKSMKS